MTRKIEKKIEKIFGAPIKQIPKGAFNNVLGAIQSGHFKTFTDNFFSRLARISTFLQLHSIPPKQVLEKVSDVLSEHGYKWAGPYSELVAFDFLLSFPNLRNVQYIRKGPVANFPKSLAQKMGQKEVDIDFSFDLDFCEVFSDVKALIPTHFEMLDIIYQTAKKQVPNKLFAIGVDDLNEVDFLRSQKDLETEIKSGGLLKNIVMAINSETTFLKHRLSSGIELNFRLAFGDQYRGSYLFTSRAIDPYRLANDYKFRLINFPNKLFLKSASMLILVSHPWFNKEMHPFDEAKNAFYRSLSRRVFIELQRDTTDITTLFPKLKCNGISVKDVSGLISGVIFLEDYSTTVKCEDQLKSYIFLNPNASNRILKKGDFGSFFHGAMKYKPEIVDDFYFDNY